MPKKTLSHFFKELCLAQAAPLCCELASNGKETLISAGALWNSALHRRHEWRRLGMKPGDLWIENQSGIDSIVNFLTCLSGDFVYTPQSLLAWAEGTSRRQAFGRDPAHPTGFKKCSESLAWPFLNQDRVFSLVLHTSGTTSGALRPVRLGEEEILHQILSHLAVLKPVEQSIRMCTLPAQHGFGLILDRLLGLAAKQILYLLPHGAGLAPKNIWNFIQDWGVQWWCTTPRHLELCFQALNLNDSWLKAALDLHLHAGGAPLSQQRRQGIRAQVKAFYWGYGLTECGPGLSLNGQAIGAEIQIRDGVLWAKTLSLGDFIGSPGKSEFYSTGDLAFIDDLGNLEVLGRQGEQIKDKSGQWIHINEWESRSKNLTGAIAVYLARSPASEGRELRLLVEKLSEQLLATVQALTRNLAEPIRVKFFIQSPDLHQALLRTKGKSLSEALKHLDPAQAA